MFYRKAFLESKKFWILLIVLIAFIFWFPTKTTPYWWDSAGYVVHTARYHKKEGFTSLLRPPNPPFSDFAHPPLFVFTLGLVWKSFGDSLLISHLFYLIFIFLALIFTYLLGATIANFQDAKLNSLVGFVAALFLLFSPVFFSSHRYYLH